MVYFSHRTKFLEYRKQTLLFCNKKKKKKKIRILPKVAFHIINSSLNNMLSTKNSDFDRGSLRDDSAQTILLSRKQIDAEKNATLFKYIG